MVWKVPFELRFAAAMLAAAVAASLRCGLPLVVPNWESTAFIGLHYVAPLAAVIGWCAVACRRPSQVRVLLAMLVAYTVVLWCHFQLKMVAPVLNPTRLDPLLWSIDTRLHALVDACFVVRSLLAPIVPYEANVYMWAFIALFYASFVLHFLLTPAVFRRLSLAILVLQGIGALGYIALPAVGPFLFEAGVNPTVARAQHYMLANRAALLDGGAAWLRAQGPRAFLSGLGAMPSLHAGCSFVFIWYGWRHLRWLRPAYGATFDFILVSAVASRWHYLVDLPVGVLFALCSIRLADRVEARTARSGDHDRAVPVGLGVIDDGALPVPA